MGAAADSLVRKVVAVSATYTLMLRYLLDAVVQGTRGQICLLPSGSFKGV